MDLPIWRLVRAARNRVVARLVVVAAACRDEARGDALPHADARMASGAVP